MAGNALLDVRDLRVTYPGRWRRPVVAVDGVSFTVRRGRTVGLVGESGSGKSSIGAALLGLAPVAGGQVVFEGEDITRVSRPARRNVARRLQAVFQDPYGSMNPARTVGETLGEALRYNVGLSPGETRGRLAGVLGEVGLGTGVLDRYPRQFSGGQLQRLAIARALAMSPSFVVCDEAVSALDLSVQAQVLNLLARLAADRGLSYLFISHDLAVVRHISDDVLVLYAGQIVESGPVRQVCGRPAHPYTRALVAAAPMSGPVSGSLVPAGGDDRAAGGCPFAPRCPFAADRCRAERPPLVSRDDGTAVACHRYAEIEALITTGGAR